MHAHSVESTGLKTNIAASCKCMYIPYMLYRVQQYPVEIYEMVL